MPAYSATLARFHRACAAAGARYALIGGMAVNAWGIPRNTDDLDVLLDLPAAAASAFAQAMKAERLAVSTYDLELSFDDGSHVTAFDEAEQGIHLDLKLALTPEERDQVRDAAELQVEGVPLRVARPEETIAFKLHFGSERDLGDARAILVRQRGRLDEARLEGFARRLHVEEALARLREDVARGP